MREDAERGLKPEAGDWAHLATKAALSAIPLVGGPAAELFSAIVIPPLAQRRDEWLQALADGLRDLQERVRGFRVESLSNNEAFVTAVMHASQAAIRNHQREKRQALRNAVLNVAANRAPKEDVQLMFLNFIDTLTPWHLHVLRFFQDPRADISAGDVTDPSFPFFGSAMDVLQRAFAEAKKEPEFFDQIVTDLVNRGLIVARDLLGVSDKRTTEMGDEFLAFVSSPLDRAEAPSGARPA